MLPVEELTMLLDSKGIEYKVHSHYDAKSVEIKNTPEPLYFVWWGDDGLTIKGMLNNINYDGTPQFCADLAELCCREGK